MKKKEFFCPVNQSRLIEQQYMWL